MSDEHLRHLPEPPTADIVRLAPEGLAGLLGDSLPNALSPAQARVAIAMHRGGRDAQAIAERACASVIAVKAFLDSLRPGKATAAAPTPAPEPTPPATPATAPAPAAEQLEAAPPTDRAPTPAPKPPIPDTELTGLQQAVIRRLRKARIPAFAIAIGMRLTPDQVMRIAGEIP